METVQTALWVVVLLVALALLFDFMNGFHDAANSIATVVSTGVLKPAQAVLFAAFFNFIAIFVFHLSVAATVGKGIVQPGVVDTHVVFGALVGAISWNLITWYYGIPSSSSHALIGGIVGAVIAKAGVGQLIASGIVKTVAFIFVSPFLGYLLGSLMMVAVAWLFRRTRPGRVDKWFRRLQLVSAGAYSLGHGGNDAQKTIGIIWMLLIATGYTAASDAAPPAVGDRELLRGDCRGHHVRRLAHRQDHGAEDHQAETRGRLLRRDGRGADAVHRHRAGHSGVDHAHHHRGHRRRGLHPARLGRALGRGGQHRVGVDSDHSGQCAGGGAGVLGQPGAVLSGARGAAVYQANQAIAIWRRMEVSRKVAACARCLGANAFFHQQENSRSPPCHPGPPSGGARRPQRYCDILRPSSIWYSK